MAHLCTCQKYSSEGALILYDCCCPDALRQSSRQHAIVPCRRAEVCMGADDKPVQTRT